MTKKRRRLRNDLKKKKEMTWDLMFTHNRDMLQQQKQQKHREPGHCCPIVEL